MNIDSIIKQYENKFYKKFAHKVYNKESYEIFSKLKNKYSYDIQIELETAEQKRIRELERQLNWEVRNRNALARLIGAVFEGMPQVDDPEKGWKIPEEVLELVKRLKMLEALEDPVLAEK